MELCSMLCANPDGMGAWGRRDTHTCMAESPHCSPKRITTLLIGNTPVQNVFGKKKENILKKKKKSRAIRGEREMAGVDIYLLDAQYS